MRKGDIRKQEILAVSEEMFCRNGYEQTSVQDIIERLHSSKGSFYHHFTSKESLLAGICTGRAAQIYAIASTEAEKTDSSVLKLDILFSGMIPLKDEKLRFLLMLLPVFTLPEGRMVRQYYCDALAEQFRNEICTQITSGHRNGLLSCTDPENAAIFVLSAINLLWVQITDRIIAAEKNHAETDLPECLRLTDCCRQCIERFLSLPYGSLTLMDIQTLRLLTEKIHTHWVA